MSLSLLAAARQAPVQAAVVIDGAVIDYTGLGERVLRAVAWLDERNARGPVALIADGGLDTFVMVHALMALGLPFIPIHARFTPRERQRVIARMRPAFVVDGDWSARARTLPPAALDRVPDLPDDERPLAIVPTSGSSGEPKGVVLPRRSFIAAARSSADNLGWRPDDRWLLCLPLAHVGGLSIITRCLLARRAVAMLPPGARLEADQLAAAIDRDRVTLLSLVPALLDRLLALDWQLPGYVRAILLGGAAASPRLLERAAARGFPVLTTYGLTETCSQVTTQRLGTWNTGELGAGPALAGVEIRIVDGAVQVRGGNLATAYHPAGESPLEEDGWLSTGDAGYLDARGNLHLLGRMNDLIVTGGENVHPLEVETALERCPGIAEACVFGVDDERWGQVVAAALVPEHGKRLDAHALRAELPRVLAPFKRPRFVAVLGDLRRTASGKLDRRMTARAAAPLLAPLGTGQRRVYDAG